MKEKSLTEYVCRFWHEFSCGYDCDGCWVYEKTVSTKAQAESWVREYPESRSYYEVHNYKVHDYAKTTIKEQLKCMLENKKSDLPENLLIDAYEDIIHRLDNDWHLVKYDENGKPNFPENTPLLLIIKKTSRKVVFYTQIYDSWSKDFFKFSKIIAWKIIETPNWFFDSDDKKLYPARIILDDRDPTCSI